MTFSLIILALLWVLQAVFLKAFYTGMKTQEIEKIGADIASWYGHEDAESKLRRYAFANNMFINMYNNKGDVLVAVDALNAYRGDLRLASASPQGGLGKLFGELKEQLSKKNAQSTHYIRGEKGGRTLFYGALLHDPNGFPQYLLVASPMPEMDFTAFALKNQMMAITFILLALSLLMAHLISRRISVPILELTKSAAVLGQGRLDASFSMNGCTEVEQLASTLAFAASELSKIDEYRKDFTANISHDLKTPLTIIKFYADMIRDVSGENAEKRNAHCRVIVQETDRLSGLVTELLELSKIQSGNSDPQMRKFSLTQSLEQTLAGFEALAEHDGYRFISDIEEDVFVNADESMIKRVLCNLLTNAVNCTGKDKTVKVFLKKTPRGGARFEVCDTGSGIPEEKLQGIWERYYKGEEHKRAIVGTGLGLPIVKGVLILHNAEFGVKSVVGEGSVFWFELDCTD
jgi:signal transduction histidine kinase